ncbi:hypothetical protein [Pseudomonas fluorescens]|uniref:hypothetical protein n=1 Tax=Pseudomonas fluorescens TaxID=294 RepID=UPI00123FE640|nr:hypothetical protein [Pseudomonas fluorescens]
MSDDSVLTHTWLAHDLSAKQPSRPTWQGLNIAEVLQLTVEPAVEVFAEHPGVRRSLEVLREFSCGHSGVFSPAPDRATNGYRWSD